MSGESSRSKALLCGFSMIIGVFVFSVGCIVLMGWILGIPALKSIHPAWVSMKANTALAFVFAGLALTLLSGELFSNTRMRVGQLLAMLVALIGILTLCEYALGWNLRIDEILFKDDTSAVATSSPGRMAPSTAVCFLLLGLATVVIAWGERWRVRPAEVLTIMVSAVSLSSFVEYAIGQPILYNFSQYTRMALHTSAIFLVLSLGLLLARPDQGVIGALRLRRFSPWERSLYAAMGLAILVILAGGGWFYHNQKQHMQHQAEAELEAVARMKVNQIVQWRAERLTDAYVIMDSTYLNDALVKWMKTTEPSDTEKIMDRFRSISKHYQYSDVMLVDASGQVLLSVTGRSGRLHGEVVQVLTSAMRERRPLLTSLYAAHGDLSPRLYVVAPLVAPNAGAVILQCDARKFLYPLIQTWPIPSTTTETLFVCRDGEDVLFLSDLRHQKDAALKLRIPLTRREVPSVMAVLGKEGVVQGIDYRGVRVLSVLQTVPDSPWFLVTKKDEEEIFTPLRKDAWVTGIIVALLLLTVMLALGFVWYQQTAAGALREREESLSVTLHSIGDGVMVTDAGGRITRLNEVAERLTGWTEAEAKGKPVGEVLRIINEETRKPAIVPVDNVLRTGEIHGLANHTVLLARDGAEYPIADSAAPIRNRAGRLFGVVLVFRNVTAERRAEQEIRRLNESLERRVRERTAELCESEERFRMMVENVKDYAILLLDPDGHVTSWNAGAERIKGYRAEEIIGQHFSRFYTPDDVANGKPRRSLEEAATTGRFEEEGWRVRKDGSRFWANVIFTALLDEKGQLRGFAKITRDITVRKRAEELLRARMNLLELSWRAGLDELLQSALDFAEHLTGSTIGFFHFMNADQQTLRLQTWSTNTLENMCKAEGKGQHYPVNQAGVWADCLRQRAPVIHNDYESLSGKKGLPQGHAPIIRELTVPILRKQAVVAVMGVGNKPTDYSERDTQVVQELLSYLMDLVDRKRAEEALRKLNAELEQRVEERTASLRESEDQFRAMANNISQLAWMGDAQGSLYWYNQRWFDYTGTTLEEMHGWGWQKVHHPDHVQRVVDKIRHCFETGEAWEDTFPLRGTDGHYRWFLSRAVPICDEHGAVLRWFGTNTDVTESKQLEMALGEAKEAAEAANRAKSEFLANVSHEVRTPMNAIIGMTDLVLETPLTGEQKRFLTTVRESADSLLGVLNDILDFAKIESGRLDLEETPFALREVVEGTASALAERAHRKGLEIACHQSPEVPDTLIGDPSRLRQILVNLIGNAIKFTSRGEVVVRVAVEKESGQWSVVSGQDSDNPELPVPSRTPPPDLSAVVLSGSVVSTFEPVKGAKAEPSPHYVTLHFSVSDTGIGIPPEKQKVIFEPFRQADASVTREYGGTGLGLAISSQLTALMQGRIWAESEAGKGSVFHFTARFGVTKDAKPRLPAVMKDLKGLRVLIVDDNATNRLICEEVTGSWGLRHTAVESGQQALAAAMEAANAGDPFALVLLDRQMPGMDGYQVAEQLRGKAEFADMVILMLTSSGDLGDAERRRELGIAACLVKPVRQSELLNTIMRAMGLVTNGKHKKEQVPGVRPLKVLLAEDYPLNQELAVQHLMRRGHMVVVAENGQEALRQLEAEDFDVVLMDVQMPVMDGFAATAAIRDPASLVRRHDIPIVAMTAHAMKGDKERCLAAGMNAYVSKPFSATDLMSVLAEIFGTEREGKKEDCGGVREKENGQDEKNVDGGKPSIPAKHSFHNSESPNSAPPSAILNTTIFDRPTLLKHVDDDALLAKKIVTGFLKDLEMRLNGLDEAAQSGDSETLARYAHTLKGATATLGGFQAHKACRQLEEIVRKGDMHTAKTMLTEVKRKIYTLEQELRKFISG
jgi:PAS domain S-box-containing protein